MAELLPLRRNDLSHEERTLCEAARQIAERAYAPYSKFRVGAAIRGADAVHTGVNVENASYGLSLCAERAALAAFVGSGDRAIAALAVACIDASPGADPSELMPCGACRQWMVELCPDAVVLVCSPDAAFYRFTVADLIPHAFDLRRSSH